MFNLIRLLAIVMLLAWLFHFRTRVAPARRGSVSVLLGILFVLFMTGSVALELLPAYVAEQRVKIRQLQAEQNLKILAAQVQAYEAQYGKLPASAPGSETALTPQELEKRYQQIEKQKTADADPDAPRVLPDSDAPWSVRVKGLKGRVRTDAVKLKAHEVFRLRLELKNEDTQPRAVDIGKPHNLQTEVLDAAGQSVPATLERSDALFSSKWKTIPAGESLNFPITFPNTDGGKNASLDTVIQLWELLPGKYTLQFKYVAEEEDANNAPDSRWVGTLKLPPIVVEITP